MNMTHNDDEYKPNHL